MPFPLGSARDHARAPTTPERRDRISYDQEVLDRSHGHGSPDFGGGVGCHHDETYCGGHIPESTRASARVPITPMEPLREWVCKGADMTSPAEYEAALCQLVDDPPDIRQYNVNIWGRVLGRGCDETEISEEKRLFTEWGLGIQTE